MERVRTGCAHFARFLKVECPTCKEVHGCHYCHDEKWEFAKKKAHIMPWKQVENIVCARCQKKQPKSQQCINKKCRIKFGNYYCEKCCVWTSNPQPIFHCDDCNTCHQAQKDKIKHCKICKTCVDRVFYDQHVKICRESTLDGDCPICMEGLRRGKTNAIMAPCGHAMHLDCRDTYIMNKMSECISCGKITMINCPLCAKSLLYKDTDITNKYIEKVREILEGVPSIDNKKVSIYCHECEKVFPNIKYHQLGIECPECKFFNTRIID